MYGKHIPQHKNMSPTSLLITLTLTAFVVGANSQTDKETDRKLTLGQAHAPDETVYKIIYYFESALSAFIVILVYFVCFFHFY